MAPTKTVRRRESWSEARDKLLLDAYLRHRSGTCDTRSSSVWTAIAGHIDANSKPGAKPCDPQHARARFAEIESTTVLPGDEEFVFGDLPDLDMSLPSPTTAIFDTYIDRQAQRPVDWVFMPRRFE